MVYTITEDGDHSLGFRQWQDSTTVTVQANTDVATVTIGYRTAAGVFKAYEGGVVTADIVIDHGRGVELMAQVSGITANSVVLGVNP